MQRQHSSQATSTLGNTPNLNIGFLHQKENPTLTYGKSKFALKNTATAKECQVVSATFIATEWFFQLKKISKVFSTSAGGSVKSNR